MDASLEKDIYTLGIFPHLPHSALHSVASKKRRKPKQEERDIKRWKPKINFRFQLFYSFALG